MLTQAVQEGASLLLPMSFEEYQALGETKHTAYYDQLVHVNPPTRRHVQIARRLTRLLEDAVPPEYEVLPEAGWAVAPQTILDRTSYGSRRCSWSRCRPGPPVAKTGDASVSCTRTRALAGTGWSTRTQTRSPSWRTWAGCSRRSTGSATA